MCHETWEPKALECLLGPYDLNSMWNTRTPKVSWEGFFYFWFSNSQLCVSSDRSVYRTLCGVWSYTHGTQYSARDSREPLQILSYFPVELPPFQFCPATSSCLSLPGLQTGSVAALRGFGRKPWTAGGLTSFISLLWGIIVLHFCWSIVSCFYFCFVSSFLVTVGRLVQ